MAVPAAADVINFPEARRPYELGEGFHEIEAMNVVAHLFAFISKNAVGPAAHRADHEIREKAVQLRDCWRIANVDVVVLVTANVCDQIVARFLRRSFRAEKLYAQVIVDPYDMRATLAKSFDCFRTNQSRGSADDHCSH